MNKFPWSNFHGLNLNWIVSEIESKMPMTEAPVLPNEGSGELDAAALKLVRIGRLPVIFDHEGNALNISQWHKTPMLGMIAVYSNLQKTVTVSEDGSWMASR